MGVCGSWGIVSWEKEFDLDYTIGIGGLDSAEPGVVEVGSVVGVTIAIAYCAAVGSLEML